MKRAFKILIVMLCVIATLILAAVIYFISVTSGVKLSAEKLMLSERCVHIYDGAGEELVTTEKRTAPIAELPDYVPNAFVAVEDKRFYNHHGLDYKRIGKAILKNVSTFSFREGASTISQQLIKNTHLSGEKTLTRKLKEVKLTRILEKNYSKEEILELYLNSIYFGHNAFGISQAARFYFGTEPQSLTPAQSAMLAALVKSPNHYSPFKDAEKCKSRRDFVLKLMCEQGVIDQTAYGEAVLEPLPDSPTQEERENAYLTLVYDQLGELFDDEDMYRNLRVYTYLEPALQSELEKTNAEHDVTALVRDNATNGIKAFYSTAGQLTRLPASTVKPLLVYGPALEENIISPATPILDEKVDFAGYSPSNYGDRYAGYISARYALAKSVNIPAVKLLNTLGCEKAVSYLNKMNLSVEKDDYSLALALGGMKRGFRLKDLADGYATFANGGGYSPSSAIARIEDGEGKILFRFQPETRTVFSAETCYLMNDMLQTAVKEGTAQKLANLPFPLCAKTGTGGDQSGNTDAYTIAYTRSDTVAVWHGNRDNSPIQTTGGGAPASDALRILRTLYSDHSPDAFLPCDGVEEVLLDEEDYTNRHALVRADPAAPLLSTRSELFKRSDEPSQISTRFSRPTIEKPAIFVKNGAVCIELCQTKYYSYVIKRENDGKITTIYSGAYSPKIYDNSVREGVSYTYTVTPLYKTAEGVSVTLPSVFITPSKDLPNDWWE